MPINIGLALSNLDFNKNNIILVDGLSIDKLKIRYNYIVVSKWRNYADY